MPGAAGAEATRRSRQANRTLRFTFSDGDVDRYGDKIDPAGWDIQNFAANPVVLWAHDDGQPPIGRASAVGVVAGKLMGAVEFVPAEISPLAESLFQMARAGFLNAVSVSASCRSSGAIRMTRRAAAELTSRNRNSSRSRSSQFPRWRRRSSTRDRPA